jgi:hypothetical protein
VKQFPFVNIYGQYVDHAFKTKCEPFQLFENVCGTISLSLGVYAIGSIDFEIEVISRCSTFSDASDWPIKVVKLLKRPKQIKRYEVGIYGITISG